MMVDVPASSLMWSSYDALLIKSVYAAVVKLHGT